MIFLKSLFKTCTCLLWHDQTVFKIKRILNSYVYFQNSSMNSAEMLKFLSSECEYLVKGYACITISTLDNAGLIGMSGKS